MATFAPRRPTTTSCVGSSGCSRRFSSRRNSFVRASQERKESQLKRFRQALRPRTEQSDDGTSEHNVEWHQSWPDGEPEEQDEGVSEPKQPLAQALSPQGMTIDEDEEEDLDASNKQQGERKPRPAEARWFDTAKVHVAAGSGGKGCVAFFREKFNPKGGPAGGNGGRGADVVFRADEGMNSLLGFRRQVHIAANAGGAGQGKCMSGPDAEARVVSVPPGTVVRDEETGAEVAELTCHGQTATVAVGGRGGKGNAAFKSAFNTAPVLAEKGERGESFWALLELRVMAEIGLIGMPNAGKSTALSCCSRARPKIANYPFTTLVPSLGVTWPLDGHRQLVLADIPGLIEGASDGRGLGSDFLRHTLRCRALVHLVDCTSPDPVADYRAVRSELAGYGEGLQSKDEVVALNKIDALPPSSSTETLRQELLQAGASRVVETSSVTGEGFQELLAAARALADNARDAEEDENQPRWIQSPPLSSQPHVGGKVSRKLNLKRSGSGAKMSEFSIDSVARGHWVVRGEAIERLVQMSDFQYFESLTRLRGVMRAAGIQDALLSRGAADGDTISIGDEVSLELDLSGDSQSLRAAWLSNRSSSLRGTSTWPSPS